MTHRGSDGELVIARELPQKCELCGKWAECRPYGPLGEQVCFDCGMKDPGAAIKAIRARLEKPS